MKKTIMPHSDEQRVVGNLYVLEEWIVTTLTRICSSREISNPQDSDIYFHFHMDTTGTNHFLFIVAPIHITEKGQEQMDKHYSPNWNQLPKAQTHEIKRKTNRKRENLK